MLGKYAWEMCGKCGKVSKVNHLAFKSFKVLNSGGLFIFLQVNEGGQPDF